MFILFKIFHNKHIQAIQTVDKYIQANIQQPNQNIRFGSRERRYPQCSGTHLSTTNQCRATPTGGDTDSVLSVNLVICDESRSFQNVLNSPGGCFRDNTGNLSSAATNLR